MVTRAAIALAVMTVAVVVLELAVFQVGIDPMVAPDYNLITWGEPI